MKHSRILGVVAMALSAGLISSVAAQAAEPTTQPVNPNEVVLQVGSDQMTAGQFEQFVSDLPAQIQAAAKGPEKRMLADQLVRVKLLAQEAKKQGLENSPAYKRQLSMLQEQLLAQTLAEQIQNSDEAKLRAYYDAHKADFETATARHILIRTAGSPAPLVPGRKELTDAQAKAKAEDIRKRLIGGEDFATLAKAESDDTGSAEHGGDLGTFGHGQMVPEFDAAVFALKPGEISQPVKTPFGYHIIQLLDKKTSSFEEVKPELASKLGGEKVEDLVAELKKKNKTSINESFFGPELPAAPVAQ